MGERNAGARAPAVVIVSLLLTASFLALPPAGASSQPVSFRHGTIDYRLTTTRAHAPAGWTFKATYHAAGDPGSYPPYMRKMTFYHPRGMRFDTTVPARCTAADAELATRGADACPAASRLGDGTVWISFMGGPLNATPADYFNGANEQVILGRSPVLTTIVRSRMRDGSIEYASPTCWPSFPALGCPVDNALQVKSLIRVPAYTMTAGNQRRSYLTTPPSCPVAGYWKTPVRLWWADGTVDTVVTRQPCR